MGRECERLQSPEAARQLAIIHVRSGNLEAARTYWERVAELAQGDAEAAQQLAVLEGLESGGEGV